MSWLWRALFAALIVTASVAGAFWLRPDRPRVDLAAASRQTPTAAAIAPAPPALSAAQSPSPQALPSPHDLTQALCPSGMNWVEGNYCPSGAQRPGRCAVTERAMGFCMDLFEYPNLPGVLPAVMVSYPQAERYCREEGKRLCSESEWTHACRQPLEELACNFGRTSKEIDVTRLWDPSQVAAQLALHDARRSSEASRCVSPWGIFDQLGNVQEWVKSEHVSGYAAGLKGGRYNQGSIGCERTVQSRQPDNRYPHTGFRCCADPLVAVPNRQ